MKELDYGKIHPALRYRFEKDMKLLHDRTKELAREDIECVNVFMRISVDRDALWTSFELRNERIGNICFVELRIDSTDGTTMYYIHAQCYSDVEEAAGAILCHMAELRRRLRI